MRSRQRLCPLALALLLGALGILGARAAAAGDVVGYVDLHSHLMAEHSFGGGWFWGTVEGPMDWAVRRCDGNFPWRSHAATVFPILSELLGVDPTEWEHVLTTGIVGLGGDTGWHLGRRRGYDRRHCRRILGFTIPGTCPQPHFEDWPMWDAIAHQQMWQGWLQQAHQGGLQVMVVSLAESNFLCQNTAFETRRYDCDEMASIGRQATFVHDFAAHNSSWVGTSPAEARALIAQGKLALVLAVEVTRLFPGGDFVAQLDQLRAQGICSVQVVHHADNRFGGAAPIPQLMKAARLTERLWSIVLGLPIFPPPPAVDITDIDEIVCRDAAGNSHACDGETWLNERGLTLDGGTLVRAMMDRGMLVDVAHLSRRSFAEVYDIAHQRGDYPLLYSHAHMWNTIAPWEERHEKYLREEEIPRITSTGGMVGLRTGPEAALAYPPPPISPIVANSCDGSARSFAQSLMYAVDHGLTVGFGADLNGFIRQMKPRYSNKCGADKAQIDAAGGPTELQKKGFAHVGLYPQLMSELQTVGVPAFYLDHLNRSAENFLRMWERSVALAVFSGTNVARFATATASSTYTDCAASPCYNPARVNDGDQSTALGPGHSWANNWNVPFPHWVELAWVAPVTASRVELFTTAGYEMRDYDIEYETPAGWVRLPCNPALPVAGNTSAHTTCLITPGPVSFSRLRVVGLSGPDVQPGYVRINEIEVY
jgi:microsomal dipeptidase-like Zn-dependent dipeptidase